MYFAAAENPSASGPYEACHNGMGCRGLGWAVGHAGGCEKRGRTPGSVLGSFMYFAAAEKPSASAPYEASHHGMGCRGLGWAVGHAGGCEKSRGTPGSVFGSFMYFAAAENPSASAPYEASHNGMGQKGSDM
jgi:hypothetical protein